VADNGERDFFVSYTAVNRSWAEWIAVQLEAAGHSTVLQAWDFRPGSDFIHKMQLATTSAGRTIAVLSPAYFGSRFGEAEWRAAFVKDPTGELGLLVPVRVQECQPPGLLASLVYMAFERRPVLTRSLSAVGFSAWRGIYAVGRETRPLCAWGNQRRSPWRAAIEPGLYTSPRRRPPRR
jgi:hypothetical protein